MLLASEMKKSIRASLRHDEAYQLILLILHSVLYEKEVINKKSSMVGVGLYARIYHRK